MIIQKRTTSIMKLEKMTLSPNTVDAYQTDLQKLLHFLEGEGIAILDTTLDDLQHFASGLHDIGIHPRSQARILSGIKSFFHFLVIADYLEGDPSELLEGPKIGFKLPEVLTVEEIDRIISAIDLGTNEGQRNRGHPRDSIQLRSTGIGTVQSENLRLVFRRRLHQGRR